MEDRDTDKTCKEFYLNMLYYRQKKVYRITKVSSMCIIVRSYEVKKKGNISFSTSYDINEIGK